MTQLSLAAAFREKKLGVFLTENQDLMGIRGIGRQARLSRAGKTRGRRISQKNQ